MSRDYQRAGEIRGDQRRSEEIRGGVRVLLWLSRLTV
jgi:hypothetical protein